jgi:hypothetical protein
VTDVIRRVIWGILGVVVGLMVALLLVMAVEAFSAVVHPFPPGFGQKPGQTPVELREEVCAHVRNYPAWVLAMVVPLWGGSAGVSTWLAARLGGRGAALVVGLLLVIGVVANAAMLPYPVWFQVLAVAAVLGLAGWGGSRAVSGAQEQELTPE